MKIANRVGKYRIRPWSKRRISDIKYFVVHHSTHQGIQDGEQALRVLYNSHLNARDWPGITYHFFVPKSGQVYQINDLNDLTYTVLNKNNNSLSVCFDGNFEVEEPTMGQLEALEFLLRKYSRYELHAHRDLTPTACCGRNLYRYLQEFKKLNYIPKLMLEQLKNETINLIRDFSEAKNFESKNVFIAKPDVHIQRVKKAGTAQEITAVYRDFLRKGKMLLESVERESAMRIEAQKALRGLDKTKIQELTRSLEDFEQRISEFKKDLNNI